MCGKKRHTKTEIRSEMSDLICGRIAAGENYNLTRDTEGRMYNSVYYTQYSGSDCVRNKDNGYADEG